MHAQLNVMTKNGAIRITQKMFEKLLGLFRLYNVIVVLFVRVWKQISDKFYRP